MWSAVERSIQQRAASHVSSKLRLMQVLATAKIIGKNASCVYCPELSFWPHAQDVQVQTRKGISFGFIPCSFVHIQFFLVKAAAPLYRTVAVRTRPCIASWRRKIPHLIPLTSIGKTHSW